MNILLTGCAGFVGWKTAEFLLKEGHRIVGLDDFNDTYSPKLKKWRMAQLDGVGSGHFRLVEGDLLDSDLLAGLFTEESFDAVINLAARAGVRASIDQPRRYVETNLTAATGLMKLMAEHGVKKLVQASSSSVYAGLPAPFREDQGTDCPTSPYAASKKAVEVMAYSYHHLHGLDVSVVRYFTVYGPAGRPDMSPLRFTHCIAQGIPFPLFGDGEQRRDFTYVDDIARGTIAALKPLGYEIINLGGGAEPLSINRMIGILESCLGKKAVIQHLPWNAADMRDTSADISKAARLLDWKPVVSPEEGLKALADWYLKEASWLGREINQFS